MAAATSAAGQRNVVSELAFLTRALKAPSLSLSSCLCKLIYERVS